MLEIIFLNNIFIGITFFEIKKVKYLKVFNFLFF